MDGLVLALDGWWWLSLVPVALLRSEHERPNETRLDPMLG